MRRPALVAGEYAAQRELYFHPEPSEDLLELEAELAQRDLDEAAFSIEDRERQDDFLDAFILQQGGQR